MIKVVYDYQVFWWQKHGGISRYICELAKHISESEDFDVKILAMAYETEYLKKLEPSLVLGFPVPQIPKTGKIRKAINGGLSKIWLQNNPPNIIHETYYSTESLAPQNTTVVTTVYDFLHEKFSESFPGYRTSKEKVESVKRADHVICISENTKKDLIEILDVEPKKVSVVHLGVSYNFGGNNQGDVKKTHPYIFYVGARGAYKNFQRLLQAYAGSNRLKDSFNLVCFGGGSLSSEELSLINALGLPRDKVLHVSGNDATLADFYQGASVFVYPSLYEGFGIPPLEAMMLGCPVACSNTSSMPEVVGNAAELFDPAEPESIADALEKVLYSTERVNNLVKLGKERVKLFSWQKCAEKTRLVYSSLV